MKANIKQLEHVTIKVDIEHLRRGLLEIKLISPNGIVSWLGTERPHDMSKNGYKNWMFMTVIHWNEDPIGTWKLQIHDLSEKEAQDGTLFNWQLTFYGESNLK